MEFSDLTPEQQAKFQACGNADEILAIAKEKGLELSDEQLEKVSGGTTWTELTRSCPYCGGGLEEIAEDRYRCTNCGRTSNPAEGVIR